jgi:hypothetical protein
MVHIRKAHHILVVVIRYILTVLIHGAAQYAMRVRITGCLDFPASIRENMRLLRRLHGIQHNVKVSAGGILHASRDIEPAHRQTVFLVLD